MIKKNTDRVEKALKNLKIALIFLIVFQFINLVVQIINLYTPNEYTECVNGVSHEIPRCLPPIELLETNLNQ